MIFELSEGFVRGTDACRLADLVCHIMHGEHYLSISGASESMLLDAIEQNAGTTDRNLFDLYISWGMSPTVELRTYLTTVSDVRFTYEKLDAIATNPSILLMENLREWSFYQNLMANYLSDSRFKNIFVLLAAASRNPKRLKPEQAGGFGDMEHMLKMYQQLGYAGISEQKIMVVMDRDTDSASIYPTDRPELLKLLSGKRPESLSSEDIYRLKQGKYCWHMWYRRAIENYIPDEAFTTLGKKRKVLEKFSDHPYDKPEKYYSYKKNQLERLSRVMTRELLEKGLIVFKEDGVEMNEMQLFLLKIAKIV